MSMPQGSKIIDVCTSDAVYAVFYQGQPIKVRRRTTTNDYDGPKRIFQKVVMLLIWLIDSTHYFNVKILLFTNCEKVAK
jgi:hypothetical protein